jgi:hypothetical protein
MNAEVKIVFVNKINVDKNVSINIHDLEALIS